MKGRLRVQILCENCGYVYANGTKVYMLPEVLECPKCHKKYPSGQSSMCAVVEMPNGTTAPTGILKLIYKLVPEDND